MKRKAISIHIKSKNSEKFKNLSEELKKDVIDNDTFVVVQDSKVYYKAEVVIEFNDGTKDLIYTMNPERYRDLYFGDRKGDMRVKRVDDVLNEITNDTIRDRVKESIEFLEKQGLVVEPEHIKVIDPKGEVYIVLDDVRMVFK